MSASSEFAAFAQERGVSGGWDDPAVKKSLNEYLKQRNMGLSKQIAIADAEEQAIREHYEEQFEQTFLLPYSKGLLKPKEDKPPADDVQPGEQDS